MHFDFLSKVQICARNPPFSITQNPKNYFLYVKMTFEVCPRNPMKLFLYVQIIFEICPRNPKKIILYMLKYFLNLS